MRHVLGRNRILGNRFLSTDQQAVDFGWAIGTHPDESERSSTGEMGEVLEELAKRSYHWFIASSEITAANPIPENAAGNVDLMAETWVKLGREEEGIDAILSNSLNELQKKRRRRRKKRVGLCRPQSVLSAPRDC